MVSGQEQTIVLKAEMVGMFHILNLLRPMVLILQANKIMETVGTVNSGRSHLISTMVRRIFRSRIRGEVPSHECNFIGIRPKSRVAYSYR